MISKILDEPYWDELEERLDSVFSQATPLYFSFKMIFRVLPEDEELRQSVIYSLLTNEWIKEARGSSNRALTKTQSLSLLQSDLEGIRSNMISFLKKVKKSDKETLKRIENESNLEVIFKLIDPSPIHWVE